MLNMLSVVRSEVSGACNARSFISGLLFASGELPASLHGLVGTLGCM